MPTQDRPTEPWRSTDHQMDRSTWFPSAAACDVLQACTRPHLAPESLHRDTERVELREK